MHLQPRDWFFPHSPELSVRAVLAWGSAAVLLGFACVMLAALFGALFEIEVPRELVAEKDNLPNRIVVIGFLAPLIETSILIWLVVLIKDFINNRVVMIVVVALAFMFLHAVGGKSLLQIANATIAFGVMSLYCEKRLGHADVGVVWRELLLIHVAYNMFGILLGLIM